MFKLVLKLLTIFTLVNECTSFMYNPYNITFNSTDFTWQGGQYIINIPEHDRISFLFTASSLEPVAEIKYAIRILSLFNNTLLQRPIYINKEGVLKQVPFRPMNTNEFNIVIRCLIKVPNRFTNGVSGITWSIQDSEIIYTGGF